VPEVTLQKFCALNNERKIKENFYVLIQIPMSYLSVMGGKKGKMSWMCSAKPGLSIAYLDKKKTGIPWGF
jgi:hypothetical protein